MPNETLVLEWSDRTPTVEGDYIGADSTGWARGLCRVKKGKTYSMDLGNDGARQDPSKFYIDGRLSDTHWAKLWYGPVPLPPSNEK